MIQANFSWAQSSSHVASVQMGGGVQSGALAALTNVTTLAISGGASLTIPYGITSDGTNLYVADSGAHQIRKIVIATGVMSTFAGSGEASSNDDVGILASFRRPQGITTDGLNLYVADTYNNKVRKIVLATGAVTTLAGSGRAGSLDAQNGLTATFYNPRGITTDGVNLYVSDSNNSTIRKIAIATGSVATIAGAAGVSGNADGEGVLARFNNPIGITTDGTALYVADTSNNLIRKVVIASGQVTTLAGKAQAFGQNDGPGAGATFTGPFGITSDGVYLYIADTFNDAIRRVEIVSGVVSSIAGKSGRTGANNPTAATVALAKPAGLVSDGKRLHILDSNNNLIRILH